jgi:hypothetical protein
VFPYTTFPILETYHYIPGRKLLKTLLIDLYQDNIDFYSWVMGMLGGERCSGDMTFHWQKPFYKGWPAAPPDHVFIIVNEANMPLSWRYCPRHAPYTKQIEEVASRCNFFPSLFWISVPYERIL